MWQIERVEYESDEYNKLLLNGWEPFAASEFKHSDWEVIASVWFRRQMTVTLPTKKDGE